MKLINSFLFVFIVNSFSNDINDQLNQMEQTQQQGVKGFVLKRMELIPPEELFKDVKPSESSESLQPLSPLISTTYVSYQVYHEDIVNLGNRIAQLETSLERLTRITSGVQKSSFNNSEFILKLIEILVASIVGGGGLIATLLTYKMKKK